MRATNHRSCTFLMHRLLANCTVSICGYVLDFAHGTDSSGGRYLLSDVNICDSALSTDSVGGRYLLSDVEICVGDDKKITPCFVCAVLL